MVNYRSNISEEPREDFGQKVKRFAKKYWPYMLASAVLIGGSVYLLDRKKGRNKFEKIFETKKGSLYFYNQRRRIWKREKFDGSVSESNAYIGSIDPNENIKVFPYHGSRDEFWKDRYNGLGLMRQIKRGEIMGFKPYFVQGYVPVGIDRDFEPTLSEDEKTVQVNKPWPYSFSIHSGHEIEWINPKYEGSNPQFRK